jgi:hypothetical protein
LLALFAAAVRAGRSRRPGDRVIGRVVAVLVGVLAILHLLEPYFVTSGLPHMIWILAALTMSALHDRSEVPSRRSSLRRSRS